MSFQGQRYLTKGVQTTIPFELQLLMWKLIDNLPEPKDYLQVFRLSVSDGIQHITHEQEQPAYCKDYNIYVDTHVNAKVYVIDEVDHCTMLLAEEY